MCKYGPHLVLRHFKVKGQNEYERRGVAKDPTRALFSEKLLRVSAEHQPKICLRLPRNIFEKSQNLYDLTTINRLYSPHSMIYYGRSFTIVFLLWYLYYPTSIHSNGVLLTLFC